MVSFARSKVLSVLIFLVAGNFANYSELSRLIERAYQQADTSTVYFVRLDEEFIAKFMKEHSDSLSVIVTSASRDFGRITTNSSTAILIVRAYDLNLQYRELLERVIRKLRARKFVIISADSIEDFRIFSAYFVGYKFTRVYGNVGNTSYAYFNYDSEPIRKLSSTEKLPDARKNLNGFVFRTTVQKDIPRVFWYPDKKGKKRIGGCFGRLLINFFTHHNATFREIFPEALTKTFSMPLAINATRNNEIDITINVWGPNTGLLSSYPVRYQSYTIMVPLNGSLDPNQYFLRPFAPQVWCLIAVTIFYIILMDIIKNVLCQKVVKFWHTFSRTMLILLNCSYSGPAKDYRFHMLILFLAFVLTNVYTIYFTSFLTVFIQIKQYNTKLDLVEHKVPMMIPEFEWPVVKGPGLTAIGFDNIVYTVDYPTYVSTTNSMNNTKFAYAIGADRARFLIGLQTFFAKPLFHTTEDELFTSHLGYLMGHHSPFLEILDAFGHRIMELGFMARWEEEAVAQALRAGFKMKIDRTAGEQKGHSPLTVNHLRFAWTCLLGGMLLAFVVFLVEKFGRNLRRIFKAQFGEMKRSV